MLLRNLLRNAKFRSLQFLFLILFCWSQVNIGYAQSGNPGVITASSVQVDANGTTRPCLLWLPDSYGNAAEASCQYPLLVFCHGMGQCGPSDGSTVFAQLTSMGPFRFLNSTGSDHWDGKALYNSHTYKFIVFAIQAKQTNPG